MNGCAVKRRFEQKTFKIRRIKDSQKVDFYQEWRSLSLHIFTTFLLICEKSKVQNWKILMYQIKYATSRRANLLSHYSTSVSTCLRSSVPTCCPSMNKAAFKCLSASVRPSRPLTRCCCGTCFCQPPPSIQAAPLGAAVVALWSQWGLEATDQWTAVT